MMDFNVHNWYYRCEGNSSVVISNKKIPLILRIPKIQKCFEIEYKTTIHDKIKFLDQIMKPMIGQYIFYEKIIQVDRDFIKKIFVQIEQYRPGYRLNLELSYDIDEVIQMYDLCTIHPKWTTISVEIKPKCGLLHLNNDGSISKQCFFCKSQFLKVKSKKWSSHSSYCPVDLYSGCPERMNHALNCLIKTPQNNFRIFENGKIIYSNEIFENNLEEVLTKSIKVNNLQSKSLEVLKIIIIKCLLFTPEEYQQDKIKKPLQYCEFSQHQFKHICNSDCLSLQKACILKCLLDIQSLNDLPTARIYEMYKLLDENYIQCNVFNNSSSSKDLKGYNNCFNNYRDLNNGPKSYNAVKNPLPFDLSLEEASLKIRNFLISRSASDCSIIISICQIDESSNESISKVFERRFITSDEISKNKLTELYYYDKVCDKISNNLNDEVNKATEINYNMASSNNGTPYTCHNSMTFNTQYFDASKNISQNILRNDNSTYKALNKNEISNYNDLEILEPENRTFVLDIKGLKFFCRVAVIDLDVKKPEKIPHYFQEDNNITENLIKIINI